MTRRRARRRRSVWEAVGDAFAGLVEIFTR